MRFTQWEWRIIQCMWQDAGGHCRTTYWPEPTANLRLWGNIWAASVSWGRHFFPMGKGGVHPVGHLPSQVQVQWVMETGPPCFLGFCFVLAGSRFLLLHIRLFPNLPLFSPDDDFLISEPPGMETKSSLGLFISLSSWFLISDFSLILQLCKFFQNFILSQLLPKLYNF